MPLGIVVNMSVKPEHCAGYEAHFDRQAALIKANEAGNRLYGLFRSRGREGSYVIVEIYDDEAALEAHRASDHHRAGMGRVGPMLAAPPDFETYDAIVTP